MRAEFLISIIGRDTQAQITTDLSRQMRLCAAGDGIKLASTAPATSFLTVKYFY